MWTTLNNIDPERDVRVADDAAGGPAWLVDATRKIPEEGFARAWPEKITMDPEVTARVEARFADLLAQVRGDAGDGGDGEGSGEDEHAEEA